MTGLANLIEGAAYSYLGDIQPSIESYKNCLKRRNSLNDACDQHVSAFALYELGTALCINVSKINIEIYILKQITQNFVINCF